MGFSFERFLLRLVLVRQLLRFGLVRHLLTFIGAKSNLYCEAIELVFGGSPKVCVLVEWKALDRVKSEL